MHQGSWRWRPRCDCDTETRDCHCLHGYSAATRVRRCRYLRRLRLDTCCKPTRSTIFCSNRTITRRLPFTCEHGDCTGCETVWLSAPGFFKTEILGALLDILYLAVDRTQLQIKREDPLRASKTPVHVTNRCRELHVDLFDIICFDHGNLHL